VGHSRPVTGLLYLFTDTNSANPGQRNVTKQETVGEWKNCFVIFVTAYWDNGAFIRCHGDFLYNYKVSV
jgi:hypothetical protein